MKQIPIVSSSEWHKSNTSMRCNLYAMYSSSTESITIDPSLMLIPVDDHLVHRGDGVFETLKCINGNIYNLNAHIDRLKVSCDMIGLSLPVSKEILSDIIIQTTYAGRHSDSMIRILVSRGTGTMGINPYECKKEQFYIVVYELPKSKINKKMLKGIRIDISEIPIKSGILATVKTCNYLPNVLMKKEAIDKDIDFTVSVDEDGNLGEGATENIGIVTLDNRLLMPSPDRILAGTTAQRIMDLCMKLVKNGVLKEAKYTSIPMNMIFKAKEVHIYGTGHNILPVIKVGSTTVGNGRPGKIWNQLHDLIYQDMTPKSELLTPIFNN